MSAIGHQGVFRLNGWSRQIHAEFQGFRITWGDARERAAYVYRGITFCAGTSQSPSTSTLFSYSLTGQQPGRCGPTTPNMQRLSAITHARFGLFRVRSPLLTESRLFSFPMGTEMFHFPTFPPTTLCVQVEVAGHYSGFFRGFPIRRSTDRSLFTSSPWLIAGYNVLHRLLMPRHPPIALSSLLFHYKDARVHCAVLKKRAGPSSAAGAAGGLFWSAVQKVLLIATDPSGPNSVLSGFIARRQGSTPLAGLY